MGWKRGAVGAIAAVVVVSVPAWAQDPGSIEHVLDPCLSGCYANGHHGGAQRADSVDCHGRDEGSAACQLVTGISICVRTCYQQVQPMVDAQHAEAQRRAQEEEARYRQQLAQAQSQIAAAIVRYQQAEIDRRRHPGVPGPGGVPPNARECDPVPSHYDTCSRACDRGDGAACTALGDAHLHYDPHSPDPGTEAAPWYRRGCAAGDATACGMMQRYGSQSERADFHSHAYALAQLACQGNNAEACTLLGSLGYGGYVFAQQVSMPEVTTSWRRGCDLGDARGCYMLLYIPRSNPRIRDELGGMPPDGDTLAQRMMQNAEAACTRDHTRAHRGCIALASILADSDTITSDWNVSELRQSVTLVDGQYLPSYPIPADPGRGLSLLDASCNAGYRPACDRAAYLRGP